MHWELFFMMRIDLFMLIHQTISDKELIRLIRKREIRFGGNAKLKIYGLLSCASGKRMKIENRVFFKNESEAINLGFRPCGHCLRGEYDHWKANR